MRVRGVVFICTIFCAFRLQAQLVEDFSDTSKQINIQWTGNRASFQINANAQLQLNATSAGQAYLSHTLNGNPVNEWEFYVQLNFNPSSNNFTRIYLQTDKEDLSTALHGYYIRLGENGNLDGVDLYRQDSLTHTRIFHGTDGTVTKSLNNLRIKVSRDSLGYWSIYSDTSGNHSFTKEGNAIDLKYPSGKYLGVFAQYTSANIGKFIWDDFYIGKPFSDTLPPRVNSISVNDNHSLRLVFNEPLDSQSIDRKNFNIPTIGNPSSVSHDKTLTIITLSFADSFKSPNTYQLFVNGISDGFGNKMNSISSFEYIVPSAGSVVINELMADPDPLVGLPNAEYIELYNTWNYPLDLSGWKIADASTSSALKGTIAPFGYVILASQSDSVAFKNIPNCVFYKTLPSLNNDGDDITLTSSAGKIIDHVEYSTSWYHDKIKTAGGWSLEKIDPTDNCSGIDNWVASVDPTGGTPGSRNSVYKPADGSPPIVSSLDILDSFTLIVQFNKSVLLPTLSDVRLNDTLTPASIVFTPDSKKGLKVKFNNLPLKEFTLKFLNISDCQGHSNNQPLLLKISPVTQPVPHRYDILISELMVDPDPPLKLPNTEYIELFNASLNVIDLTGWKISDLSTSTRFSTAKINPGEYLILCKKGLESQFGAFGPVIGLSSLPSLNNDLDSLFLTDASGKTIDALAYNITKLADPFKANGGWSIERNDLSVPCSISEWHFSQSDIGGTPGSKNSTVRTSSAIKIQSCYNIDGSTIAMQFNRQVDSSMAANPSNYTLNPPLPIHKIEVSHGIANTVLIHLDDTMSSSVVYILQSQIHSCNSSETVVVKVGKAQQADSFDMVINEILFDPYTYGNDFVEIYNRSGKIIDLSEYYIANVNDQNKINQFYKLCNYPFQLMPSEYAVITTNTQDICNRYTVIDPESIIEVQTLPTFPDNKGTCVLLNQAGKRIDQVNYSKTWHFPNLASTSGVSLEKLNPSWQSNDSTNWHSAASDAGYATPGYVNSQFMLNKSSSAESKFWLERSSFSPDDDGFEDILPINYASNISGSLASVYVYDNQSRLIKTIANNSLLASQSKLTWDGTTNEGKVANPGIYIIYITTSTAAGNSTVEKLGCTLNKKF